MKILLINRFHYRKGGSEAVYFNTAELLRRAGKATEVLLDDRPYTRARESALSGGGTVYKGRIRRNNEQIMNRRIFTPGFA